MSFIDDISFLSNEMLDEVFSTEAKETRTISWKYVKPLENIQTSVKKVEKMTGTSVPKDLRDLIRKCNGGRPSLSQFNVKGKDFVFQSLLSFNEKDRSNVFKMIDIDTKYSEFIPFALVEGGDLLCIYKNKVQMLDHEDDKMYAVASSVNGLLDMLH